MRRKLSLLIPGLVAMSAASSQAISIANGDLVVVLQKSGTEVILNLGSATGAHTLDLTSAATSLGGSLEGAKLVAIGVQDPARQTPDFGFGPQPQENIMFSSSQGTAGLDDLAIENAMNITDTAAPSGAWFWQVRQLSSNVVQTSASFSYQNNLGLGTDAIANNFPFSIAGIITNGLLSTGVFDAIRGYADFGGPPTSVTQLGSLSVSGSTLSYSVVPEPGTLLLVGAGVFGLGILERRTRRAA